MIIIRNGFSLTNLVLSLFNQKYVMKSMTGYGKAVCNLPDKKVTIEIKSINSKQLDISLRIPAAYRDKDADIRGLVSNVLERGKVEIFISVESLSGDTGFSLNKELAKKYYADLLKLSEELGVPMTNDAIAVLMRIPDIAKTQIEEINDEEWWQTAVAIEKAVADVNAYRKIEGAALCDDMLDRIEIIQNSIPKIEAFEKERMLQIRKRIMTNMSAFIEQEKIDLNRFEQELIYYMEKIDFTEEKVRLQKHCEYFTQTIKEPAANGRKLSFITQEIGREINTLGSKANDSDIQKIVIEMKDELEKIKEQLLNVL
jgi:uncharacterized protein (TIGR00255 family)